MLRMFALDFVWPDGVAPPPGAPRNIMLSSTRLDQAIQEATPVWEVQLKILQPQPASAQIRDTSSGDVVHELRPDA